LIDEMIRSWGRGSWRSDAKGHALHEAHQLRLNIDKAITLLGWRPRWDLAETCARTAAWYRTFYEGARAMREFSLQQINDYMEVGRRASASRAVVA
jgi:CDP-glucose 4,6-dehydratase